VAKKKRENNKHSLPTEEPQKSRKIVFSIIAVLIPVLFFVVLESGLRLANYGGDLSLFVEVPGEMSDYMMCNHEVAKRFFFTQDVLPSPSKDLFLKDKPKNTFRIFVFGGSTAAGFPYGNNIMFSRILNHRLQQRYPEIRIEVVNTAMSAINSYAFVDYLDEVLDYEPDAILVYAGHNEYYGALGVASTETLGKSPWLVKTYLSLQRYRTFLLLREGITQIRQWMGKAVAGDLGPDPTATLMERIVSNQYIPYQESLYDAGKLQFEYNLQEILRKARNANVSVILSELVCNVRDQQPLSYLESGKPNEAQELFKRGTTLLNRGDINDAEELLVRAKDFDALRFRAPEEFNYLLYEIAAEFEAPVVPMKQYFESASPNGLIGDNLMVDHLHPNRRGYALMAEAFYDKIVEENLIAPQGRQGKESVFNYLEWGFTDLDSLLADYRIRYLKGGWPFRPQGTKNNALSTIQTNDEVEKVAKEVLVNKALNLEVAHLKLAEFYEKQGLFRLAFEEYKSLYCMIPFETMFYERAARLLIKLQDFDQALHILHASLKVRESSFSLKWIGQILLQQNRIEDALPYLERALQYLPEDNQLKQNLGRAYLVTGKKNKAAKIFQSLQND